MKMTINELKKILDVALLKPTATAAEIEALASVIRAEGFGQICVNTFLVSRAAAVLRGSDAKVVACVGFPMGAVRTETKVFETERALGDGAHEIDMVLNLGAFFGEDHRYAEADVRAVVKAAAGLPVKVILETPFLSRSQKIDAAHLVQNGGASFVKTCTGFSPDPLALYEDVRLLRQTIGPRMGLKASGRVGNAFRVSSLLEAGANRFGLILEQAREILRGWDDVKGDAA
jgi:deoxyribose-phosphate aldolase